MQQSIFHHYLPEPEKSSGYLEEVSFYNSEKSLNVQEISKTNKVLDLLDSVVFGICVLDNLTKEEGRATHPHEEFWRWGCYRSVYYATLQRGDFDMVKFSDKSVNTVFAYSAPFLYDLLPNRIDYPFTPQGVFANDEKDLRSCYKTITAGEILTVVSYSHPLYGIAIQYSHKRLEYALAGAVLEFIRKGLKINFPI